MEKNMKENFEKLKERVEESLNLTDLDRLNYYLSKIDSPTLLSGVGGSSVVSEFGSKILEKKNRIITKNVTPRDLKYIEKDLFKNIIICSYEGKNYGVEVAILNNLKHYLLSKRKIENENITNLTYINNMEEKSFISLAATLIPCSILLNYYLNNNIEEILNQIDIYKFDLKSNSNIYEIFSGIDTSTISKYLESTLTESGIGVPIIHDKYDYCHGRSTLSINNDSVAIYLNTSTELDKKLLNEIYKYYKEVIVINIKQTFLGEFKGLVEAMYLTKEIAEKKRKDLSGVDYNPIVKKIYYYKGKM